VSATFPGDACAPYALARLFRESYSDSCRRVMAAGGDYQRVTYRVMHRLLQRVGIARVHGYRRPRIFNSWRKGKRGAWVVTVTGNGSRGHCVTLRDGVAMDNGWVGQRYGRVMSLRVHAAWKLSEA